MYIYIIVFAFSIFLPSHAGFFAELCDIATSNPFGCCLPIPLRRLPTCDTKIAKFCSKWCVWKHTNVVHTTPPLRSVDSSVYMMNPESQDDAHSKE